MLSHPYLMALIGLVFVAVIVSMGHGVGWDLSADVGSGRRHAPLWVMVFLGLPLSAAVAVAGVIRQIHLNRAARRERIEARAAVSSPGRRAASRATDAPGVGYAPLRQAPTPIVPGTSPFAPGRAVAFPSTAPTGSATASAGSAAAGPQPSTVVPRHRG
jgi:hypothetical protein